jgi:hypothetical protein
MSYILADGSLSTDYKIGDKFTHKLHGGIYKFITDDGTENPWFKRDNGCRHANNWRFFTPVKPTALINQLRETIKQLEATIQEIER